MSSESRSAVIRVSNTLFILPAQRAIKLKSSGGAERASSRGGRRQGRRSCQMYASPLRRLALRLSLPHSPAIAPTASHRPLYQPLPVRPHLVSKRRVCSLALRSHHMVCCCSELLYYYLTLSGPPISYAHSSFHRHHSLC